MAVNATLSPTQTVLADARSRSVEPGVTGPTVRATAGGSFGGEGGGGSSRLFKWPSERPKMNPSGS